MHSKQTVKYICESFPSGNHYYYKKELITHDCWENIDSLQWSRARPISKSTFIKREKEGYKTEYIVKKKAPAQVIPIVKK
ncbi:hypothetical protein N0O92_15785 [Alkalihalobacillus sp. MEB130]|uniref:hypothetical protein n=1 Tax=Alkalihalobacillus sp. MEB130 TaxID=2976704 RepID=UPI0028DDA0D4|nr:hypothetical protein [Alkalihalobacillus sp. MEB130]MDT8861679.1 hypothetical protein [Alkalihalobacillus sp. MEB130]